jgi:hypothetical protein
MKYALLVHQTQEHFDRRNDATAVAAGKAYGEALQAAGIFVGGAGLDSPQNTTTVSVRDGKRQVHDGPYAETKEFLAGFGIIDVPNLDAALEWAARHPAAGFASIEVRPLLGAWPLNPLFAIHMGGLSLISRRDRATSPVRKTRLATRSSRR